MSRSRFLPILALLLVTLTAGTWIWQNPGALQAPITAAEADRYLRAVERVPLPAGERDAILAALRRFMAEDDGRPLQMLNLMRYFPALQPIDGSGISFQGTPADSNAHYEAAVTPLLLKVGGYPAYAGGIGRHNLIGTSPALDQWSRVLLVRYPNRRAFMDLLTDPAYAPLAPYKLQALQLVLTPTTAEIVIPPLPLIVAVLSLILFLAAGWRQALQRSRP